MIKDSTKTVSSKSASIDIRKQKQFVHMHLALRQPNDGNLERLGGDVPDWSGGT
jgi:hypothetical protein